MSLKLDAIFQQMAQSPQVVQAAEVRANQVKKYIEMRWPEVNDLSARDRQFLHDGGDVVRVTSATRGTNRPTHVVTVRHPGAVAKQAKDGFLTKAVQDAS